MVIRYSPIMTGVLIGYARCSTDKQDLAAQRAALERLGVAADRIYTDHGLTGTNRARPGLDQALAAVRAGDTLVVPKLDRLARSVPDARAIADALAARGVKLALGASVYDPADPMGKMFFNILATFAEFEADLIRLRTREGMAVARAKGQATRQAAQALRPAAGRAAPDARHRRLLDHRPRRAVLRVPADRLPDPPGQADRRAGTVARQLIGTAFKPCSRLRLVTRLLLAPRWRWFPSTAPRAHAQRGPGVRDL